MAESVTTDAETDEYAHVYETLRQQGYDTEDVDAAIEYLQTAKSQAQVADQYDIPNARLRSVAPAVIAITDFTKPNKRGPAPKTSKVELCTEIAALLDWEEGQEYSIREQDITTDQPYLNKTGWEDVLRLAAGQIAGGDD